MLDDEIPDYTTAEEFCAAVEQRWEGVDALSVLMESRPEIAILYMLASGQHLCKQYALLSSCAVALLAEDPRTTPWDLLRVLASEIEVTAPQWVRMRGELVKMMKRVEALADDA